MGRGRGLFPPGQRCHGPGACAVVPHSKGTSRQQIGSPVDQTRAAVMAAAAAYTANLALGLSVAAGRVDTSEVRWVHHGLYILTCTLTASALAVGAARGRTGVAALAPAAVPLFLLQRHGAHPVRRHGGEALAAGPFYVGALLATRSRRGS